MHKEQIAESILGLVTTRERAAATAGDLSEQAGFHGGFWFWSSVLRTTLALSWRTFLDNPFQLLWLGFRGSVLGGLLSSLAQMLAIAASLAFFPGTLMPHFPWPGGPFNPALPESVHRIYYVLIFAVPILSMFYVGRWVAHRAPGREMAAAMALIALQFPLAAIASVVFFGGWGSQPPVRYVTLAVAVNLTAVLANLAGALQVRRVAS